ncbi:uncharacterized protein LOC129728384 [Wyeomyia smithii]|uniref:uncharacterized protein LOC129728384 n=1 Tax=Wyeomyia smithii TaxID=174621 RepID=UPI002467E2E1|nr:uncharacterized protein LOC129728384 [Wyeomyia smithii]
MVVLNKPDLQQVNLLRIANLDHITKLRRDHTTLQHTTTGFLILFVAMTLGIAIRTMKKQLGWCITQRETSAEKTQHLQPQQNTQKFLFTTTNDHISNSNIPVEYTEEIIGQIIEHLDKIANTIQLKPEEDSSRFETNLH